MFPGTCFHTLPANSPAEGPQWKLNFPDDMYISRIEILNRRDCCSPRLKGAKVIIGDSETYKPVVLGTHDGDGGWTTFETSMHGSYVMVQGLPGSTMHFCGFKMYGESHGTGPERI